MSAVAAVAGRSAVPRTVSVSARLMGGRVGVHVQADAPGEDGADRADSVERARHDVDRVLRRVGRWADRLTRFSDSSELARLNASPSDAPVVGPTLAAVLDWGRSAASLTGGIVDITLLDARLCAESGLDRSTQRAKGADAPGDPWTTRGGPRRWEIGRHPGLRFDLDGVGKGWLADRAARLLWRYPAAVVDADGDIAISLDPGQTWQVAVPHPADPAVDMAILDLVGLAPRGPQRFGVATSGTSVHRWPDPHGDRHHLIDPRTERPAVTDVVQATVLAGSAAEAEVIAKAVVILGSAEALRLVDRPAFGGTVLLTERGEILATPSLTRWLA